MINSLVNVARVVNSLPIKILTKKKKKSKVKKKKS